MQIHIRPVARGDKNYVRAIVKEHFTSPAGDCSPVRSADHVWLFTHLLQSAAQHAQASSSWRATERCFGSHVVVFIRDLYV